VIEAPSPSDASGRDASGRFAAGNRAGKGNPHARRAQRLRAELFRAVSPGDLKEIVAALVQSAKKGDTVAAREVLDRVLGRPVEVDLIQRLDQVEGLLQEARRW
jgi:hypothetical protein